MVDKKSFFHSILLGLLISAGLYITSGHGLWTIAFLVGFGMFTANVYAIATISSLLVTGISQSPAYNTKRSKTIGMVIGAIKLVVLMLGLYLALVYFRLPGIVFAAGAFSALVILVGSFSIRYLKQLGQPSGNKTN